ncbi:MotA/TolQ/ExbB proton channel family protein [Citricoccus nitrophenolicus]|uniref:MotA/TolQ/ExbB proton channel family protein n=1 Tax=Citricoccus nitrophenolicus TaxID=863575 RepID=A0ABV0II19_9MICC|nr:MotA/TolQ/ExbB proton channel family protein [Citricoccus sp. I39-566]WMY77973.1 MotA/TolQ/ExbB proton channel family protein [Citricoccus sp. I39-566]
MDPLMIIGIIAAFASLFIMVILEGGTISSLFILAPMIIVFGGTIAVSLMGTTLGDLKNVGKIFGWAFRGRLRSPQDVIDEVSALSAKARGGSLLELEAEAEKTEDPLIRTAITGLADGLDSDALADLLEAQKGTRQNEVMTVSNWFSQMGGYAPTIGIVGTVASLIHVMENLAEPENIGHMIAAAFVATLWGLLTANFFWHPIATRIRRLCELEQANMEVIVEGALSIQAGVNSTALTDRLHSLIPDYRLGASGKGKGTAENDGGGSASSSTHLGTGATSGKGRKSKAA